MGKFKKTISKPTKSGKNDQFKPVFKVKAATNILNGGSEKKTQDVTLNKPSSVPQTPKTTPQIAVKIVDNKKGSSTKKSTNQIKRLKKKDKLLLRKDDLLKRVQATKEAFIEDKAQKKRQKTEIVKDMKPLLDALPSLDGLFKFNGNKLRTGVPAYDKPNKKAKKQLRKDLKVQEFQNKLNLHKNMIQDFQGVSSNKRREAILEAVRRRKCQQATVDASMEE